MSGLALRLAGSVSERRSVSRLALLAFANTAVLTGGPRASLKARRRRMDSTLPENCGEFCAPASPCHNGCNCPPNQANCFVCNGCGEVNRLRCFNKACSSGFCWKPVC